MNTATLAIIFMFSIIALCLSTYCFFVMSWEIKRQNEIIKQIKEDNKYRGEDK